MKEFEISAAKIEADESLAAAQEERAELEAIAYRAGEDKQEEVNRSGE